MPYILTEEEKRKLREEYLNNVKRINSYLPDELKVKPNLKDLNKKLNDPIEQRKYKRALELKANSEKRQKIALELFEKYKHLCKPDHVYLLDRNMAYFMDERPEAQKYNEAMMKTYVLHPEAVAQYYYKKAMQLDPTDMFKITKNADMDNQLIEYYAHNRIPCEFGFTIKDAHTNYEQFNFIAAKYIPVIKNGYELLASSDLFVKNVKEGYFTLPTLNDDQQLELSSSILDNKDSNLSNDCSSKKTNQEYLAMNNRDIKKAMDGLKKGKYDVCMPGGFSNYVFKNKEDGTYASFVENIIADKEDEYEIIKLDDKAVDKVKNFYERDYISAENVKFPKPVPQDEVKELLDEFRYKYAINNNAYLHKLEEKKLSELHSSVRKGFFEFIRRSTSQYTKDLQTAIKNFETPENKDYKNKDKLKAAAEAYLKHRNVRNREDALRQSSAAKNRSLIALDIISAIDSLKEKAVINMDNDLKKDDDIIVINEKGKDKDLFVDPEEILNDGPKRERKPLPEFCVQLKEEIDKDIDADQIKYDDDNLSIDDSKIIDEAKI